MENDGAKVNYGLSLAVKTYVLVKRLPPIILARVIQALGCSFICCSLFRNAAVTTGNVAKRS